MRIKFPHIPYIANKIMSDISRSSFIETKDQLEKLNLCVKDILEEDLNKEKKLDERARELLEKQEDEIELTQIDRKSMFRLVKRKLATEYDVILDKEERHSRLSHQTLNALVENDYINFVVNENRVKNLILSSIEDCLKIYETIGDDVYDKISNYKNKPVPGSEEYELIFEKLYQEEFRKKGMFRRLIFI